MKQRRKDFIEVFLFSFVRMNIALIVTQIAINMLYFTINAETISALANFRLFMIMQVLFAALSSIVGIIYTSWYKEYKDKEKENGEKN